MAMRMPKGRLASVANVATRKESLMAVGSSGDRLSTDRFLASHPCLPEETSSGSLEAGRGGMPLLARVLLQMKDRLAHRRGFSPPAPGASVDERPRAAPGGPAPRFPPAFRSARWMA